MCESVQGTCLGSNLSRLAILRSSDGSGGRMTRCGVRFFRAYSARCGCSRQPFFAMYWLLICWGRLMWIGLSSR